jgi:hypothetical protein
MAGLSRCAPSSDTESSSTHLAPAQRLSTAHSQPLVDRWLTPAAAAEQRQILAAGNEKSSCQRACHMQRAMPSPPPPLPPCPARRGDSSYNTLLHPAHSRTLQGGPLLEAPSAVVTEHMHTSAPGSAHPLPSLSPRPVCCVLLVEACCRHAGSGTVQAGWGH